MNRRMPAVEGAFYPHTENEVNQMILGFEKELPPLKENIKPKIIISPHAGLMYSGQTATHAFRLLKDTNHKRIIILAPSHRHPLQGVSIASYDSYYVNGKDFEIDKEYSKILKDKFKLDFFEHAHRNEHSAEVMLPFLNYYNKNCKIVVMVYGQCDPNELSSIIDFMLEDESNMPIVSTDLSHFYDYDTCKKIDNIFLDGVLNYDLDKILKGEACGMTGTIAAILSGKKAGLNIKLLDYRNSGDIIADKSSVVGYASLVLYN